MRTKMVCNKANTFLLARSLALVFGLWKKGCVRARDGAAALLHLLRQIKLVRMREQLNGADGVAMSNFFFFLYFD